jgi:hypothetical protein
MAPNDTTLPPKVRRPRILADTTPSADDNADHHPTVPTENSWCPEIVEILAKYGQTPADIQEDQDMIVSDDEDENATKKPQAEEGELFATQ